MARDPKNEYRDPATKRYAFWNDFARLCECGHNLGVHIAGGFDCMNGDKAQAEFGGTGEPCSCEKFRPQRKRK